MVLFWVWATLPPAKASCYRYEVHLDHKGPDGKHQHQARHYSHYTGVVLTLDIHSHGVTKRHMRSIVYFSQYYLCYHYEVHLDHKGPTHSVQKCYFLTRVRIFTF